MVKIEIIFWAAPKLSIITTLLTNTSERMPRNFAIWAFIRGAG